MATTTRLKKGLSRGVVEFISRAKKEPTWLRTFRRRAFSVFEQKAMPAWGPDLAKLDLQKIIYFKRPLEKPALTWQELPKKIRETYEKIGIPEAERKNLLSGTGLQYDSEVVYESIQQELKKQGVIFCDMDTAVRKYPRLVRQYFGTLIPPSDNKFAALNSACWSGGSFLCCLETKTITNHTYCFGKRKSLF